MAGRIEVVSWSLARLIRQDLTFALAKQRLEQGMDGLKAYCGGCKRISHDQSRRVCTDMDIVLCADGVTSLDLDVTPWVCQRPDLRYRWTADGITRLAYLADCWDAYSRCAPELDVWGV